jgi:hypothetical protein
MNVKGSSKKELPITVYAIALLLASWSPPELASSSG